MRRLLLLRHAKTERVGPTDRDRDRRLTERGRNDAPTVGSFMARHRLIPDLVLLSPAKRTLETWELVAAVLGAKPRVATDERIYNAGSDTLVELIRETGDARALLLIGHNPGFHDLARQLVGSGDIGAGQSLAEGLPTSGLVVIEFAFQDWSKLRDGGGRLERFVSPKLIAAASD
jgi:phosphohistidine phosphatase